MPDIILDFSKKTINAYFTDDNTMQKTESITITGSPEYSLKLKLQNGVTLINETKGTSETGTVEISGGDKFYLKAPLTINGTWTSASISNCKYRFQPIVYRTANDESQNLVSKDLTAVVDSGTVTSLTVNWLNAGNLIIHKVDGEDKSIVIPGTVFDIYDSSNNLVGTIKTNSNGIAKLNNIPMGKYKIVEKSTNAMYKVSTDQVEVTLNKKDTEITITNERRKGILMVFKYDNDGKTTIKNVKFALYNKNNELIGTYTTDAKGKIEIKALDIGEYYLKEIQTDARYKLNTEKINVQIKTGETSKVNVYNQLIEGQVRIIKIDKDNNKITIPGVEFEILDRDMKLIETLVTDENGSALSKKLPVIGQKYYVREKSTHDIYVMSNELKMVELKGDKITDIVFENEKKKGTITVLKVDKLNEDIKLQGVIFGIYNEDKELVDTIITDENGEGTSDRLVIGTYFVKELDTGTPYYLLDEEVYKTQLIEDGENILLQIDNEKVDINVTVGKKRKYRS